MSFFISANRKVTFEIEITIHDLDNLPYISGLFFCKWKGKNLSGSTRRETVGKDHTVRWDHKLATNSTLIIGKDGYLQPNELTLTFRQVTNGIKNENIGQVAVNLSEFAGARSTQRKYLLNHSKVNSFLRITVSMKLIKGHVEYKVYVPCIKKV
ncbi:hypothetical protein HK099_007601 [Clydaea vesicula]|uniref:C2 NT-type domain-containing protein n=1 Tax=Clydaea vesicula TaxID=447962 RepID=A0AAD5U5E5_9FUNG|nr:hypothetical protein HK099_007601 [Clydaea vesicula]